jgi:hypothetical protein
MAEAAFQQADLAICPGRAPIQRALNRRKSAGPVDGHDPRFISNGRRSKRVDYETWTRRTPPRSISADHKPASAPRRSAVIKLTMISSK